MGHLITSAIPKQSVKTGIVMRGNFCVGCGVISNELDTRKVQAMVTPFTGLYERQALEKRHSRKKVLYPTDSNGS